MTRLRADSWLSVHFSETDVEDEGCGEVHCEREEQREYHLPLTYTSLSLSLPLWFYFSFFARGFPQSEVL